ncbi:MAG: anthranilate synthase component I family protein [Candidatus Omnitrophica bacterium]|nr:anthranilate synthase component I family protein [Candidatus Omnitrophota bacterium]
MQFRTVFPSRKAFDRLRRAGRAGVSFVVSRPCEGTARALFETTARASRRPLLLESSRTAAGSGRFSFMLAEPYGIFQSKQNRWAYDRLGGAGTGRSRRASGSGDPLTALKRLLPKRSFEAGCPLPFAGGVAGLFAYELKDQFERFKVQVRDPWGIPDLDLGFYDQGLALDHESGRLCAFRAFAPEALKRLSYETCAAMTARAYQAVDGATGSAAPRAAASFSVRRIGNADAARSNFVRAVKKIRQHIHQGDVYQVNLSQVIEFAFSGDAYGLYLRQAGLNPTSFAAYADFGDYQLVSASPERLVRVDGRRVSTRPIAGTRPRSKNARIDRSLTAELLLSPKERAEHVMLVDLERNDLGRVCRPGSVRVDELMAVEKYSHVKHIVSNVTGHLAEGRDAWDVIRAVFPGGTITGAPKIRAMEIIGRLEGRVRGPYTGSIGYVGYDGNCDLNIVIRTLWMRGRRAYLQAGAGIVADSDPQKEYEETLHKAAAFLDVLGLRAPDGQKHRRAAR